MKTIVRSTIAALCASFAAGPVLAAVGARHDHSPTVIWGFLGFCALIVIAQVLPAIRQALRLARKSRGREAEAAVLRVPVDK